MPTSPAGSYDIAVNRYVTNIIMLFICVDMCA